MKKKKSKSKEPSGFDPITIALAGLLVLSCWSSYKVYHNTDTVLETLQHGEGLALIVTDGGIKSDSQKDEQALSSATKGLENAKSESIILSIVCAGMGLALAVRLLNSKKG
jgi:hypothetical protein